MKSETTIKLILWNKGNEYDYVDFELVQRD